jgi:ribosome-binding factor A
MTERRERLDELLLQEISRVISRDVEDPRVGFVTVTRVDVSPDLSHARVWVSLIGQPDERKQAFRALGRAMPFVRHQLGVLRLRRIPELHLLLDDSIQQATRVMALLDDLGAGQEPRPAETGETLPTPGSASAPDDGEGDAEAASAGKDAEKAAAKRPWPGDRRGGHTRGRGPGTSGTSRSGGRAGRATRRTGDRGNR